eukprot:TRINITY_DN3671_c0_g4_i1.p3 TRINITY_DN3671_c0_g4~~TRINITY_DN3671_c0_g4_i1.p3  ORF type:complete len:103 (+),score=28.75 TRINITY_DN3671_c0_g4_i1:96-404(+)
MNKQSTSTLEESLREQRRLLSSFDITAVASTAPANLSQPFHSFLKSSLLLKKLKFGSFNKAIIDPASSGDEDEEKVPSPSIMDVAQQIFDESAFVKVLSACR